MHMRRISRTRHSLYFFRVLYTTYIFFKNELTFPYDVKLKDRIRMWKGGFFSKSYLFFDLEKNDPEDYVSDYAKFIKSPFINGKHSMILRDKYLFSKHMSKYKGLIPKLYASIHEGRIEYPNGKICKDNLKFIRELCEQNKFIVLKQMIGSSGDGLMFISLKESKFVVNEQEFSYNQLKTLIDKLSYYIVTEYIEQAEYSKRIYPRTTNTIRLLTMWDYNKNKPFIAAAIHKFGTSESYPKDNCDRFTMNNYGIGGLCASIDIESGEMKKVSTFEDGKVLWVSKHDETDEQITGVKIPHWNKITSRMLEICEDLSKTPYIGWDIVVTNNGFVILEGNSHSGLAHIQSHKGLLSDERVVRFFREHKTISRRKRKVKV